MNNKSGSEQHKCGNCWQPMHGIHSCDPRKMGEVMIELKDELSHLHKLCEEHETRLAHLNIVLEGYKLIAGLSTPDHLKVQGMIEKQLATQTERVRELGEALKGIIEDSTDSHGCGACFRSQRDARKALKQDSLGDGGNGE